MLRSPALPSALAIALAGCHGTPPAETPTRTISRPVEVLDLTMNGSTPDEDMAPRIAVHTERVAELAEACYEPRLVARPTLGGEHALRLWVSSHEVIRVTPEESTLDDPELEQCVKEALLAYEIPPEAPSGGVRVRFRLVFTPPAEL